MIFSNRFENVVKSVFSMLKATKCINFIVKRKNLLIESTLNELIYVELKPSSLKTCPYIKAGTAKKNLIYVDIVVLRSVLTLGIQPIDLFLFNKLFSMKKKQ